MQVLFLLFAAALLPQDDETPSQKELIQKRDEKLRAGFLKLADWTIDYDEARARAKKSGRLILVYLTRSWPP